MMTLARRDPFQDLLPLRDAMNHLLESSVVASNTIAAALSANVFADGDNYGIEVAIPGLNPEAVNVAVLGNRVTISGEYPQPPEGRQYLFRERPVGRFERTLTLPAEIDADKVTFTQGMDITFVTTTKKDDEARELLRLFGMPFREEPK